MIAGRTRVVVVDDHNLFRAGVIELLQTSPDIEVVGQGASGVEAITLARSETPEVVVLDVEMPGPGARATIHRILEASPATRVVLLTMHDDPKLVRDLFAAGASGYLLKSAGRNELVAGINAAARNEGSVVLAVSRATVLSLGQAASTEPALLSAREIEVLGLLAEGKTNRDIAAALFISPGTVKRHLTNIYGKLGAASRLGAVQRGVALGILPRTAPEASPARAPTAG